jgi:hypothetical protein
MKRTIYRKWYNPDKESENFLLIDPSGLMLQISIEADYLGEKVEIYQTKPMNPMNEQIFIKHKEACTKGQFEKAQSKALSILDGTRLKSMLRKRK